MIYNRSNGKAILQNPAATGIMLQSNEKCEYVYLAVNPHAKIEKHALSIPVTFFVIHGSGELILDGTVYSVTKCDLVEVAADVPREWINTTDSTLEVLVIKHLKNA
ncbi:MAG: hypothetical protein GQF41_4486 [Candidatus Rifleibacterium amylolyticum]|nr:MAG: hypothetical protein GQF41_4486 [Candidatus Rifleibacterium amylolyticum]